MKTIHRNKYLQDLIDRKENSLIKVVTGIRRVGKSFLLFNLFYAHLLSSGVSPSRIITIQLDDLRNQALREPFTLLDYIEQHLIDHEMHYVLLDEIQLVPQFEEVLNSLLHKNNVDVYVTGSNSKFLSHDVLTAFRGRGDEVHVYPLTFKEFMTAFEGDIYQGWAQYMLYGGLPLILSRKTDQQKSDYLIHLFKETYLKDITARHEIRHPLALDTLLDILSSSIGSLTSPTKIAATFKSVWNIDISKNTVDKHLEYFENAFVVHRAQRYNVKGRKYISSPSKFYFEDIGLRNARLNFRQNEPNHIMENIVYNELRHRGFNVDVGVVEKKEKQADGSLKRAYLEIDFIARQGSRCYYIQSAWRMSDPEKEIQEKMSLKMVGDFFKRIILVDEVVRPQYDDNGILIMSIYDFLLNDNSLEI